MFVAKGGKGLDQLWECHVGGCCRPDTLGFVLHRLDPMQRLYMVSRRPARPTALQAATRVPQPLPLQAVEVSPLFSLGQATSPLRGPISSTGTARVLPSRRKVARLQPAATTSAMDMGPGAAHNAAPAEDRRQAPPPGSSSARAPSKPARDTLVAAAGPAVCLHTMGGAAATAASATLTGLPSLPALSCPLARPTPEGPGHPRIADMAGLSRKGAVRGGGKPWNQDRGLLLSSFRTPQEALVGVMDGHGSSGHLVSAWLAGQLPGLLLANALEQDAQLKPATTTTTTTSSSSPPLHLAAGGGPAAERVFPGSLLPPTWVGPGGEGGASPPPPPSPDCFHRAFLAADQLLCSSSGLPVMDSGSTAVLVHLGADDTLTAAWVGDSRAVLGRRCQAASSRGQVSAPVVAPALATAAGPDWMHLEGGVEPGASWSAAAAPTPGSRGGTRSSNSSSSSSSGGWEPASSWSATQLTDDHKPDRPDELGRIVCAGGRVAQFRNAAGLPVGPPRVWFAAVDYPGLAMSRAFGDMPCKTIGVTATPQMALRTLAPEDQVLVVASDGVWEYLSNEEVVALAGSAPSAAEGARRLVDAAEAAWARHQPGYVDDITAVVVQLQPPAPTPAPPAPGPHSG